MEVKLKQKDWTLEEFEEYLKSDELFNGSFNLRKQIESLLDNKEHYMVLSALSNVAAALIQSGYTSTENFAGAINEIIDRKHKELI